MSSDVLIPAILSLPDGLVGLPDTRTIDVQPIAGGAFVELTDHDEPALGWLAVAAEDVRPGMTAALRAASRIAADEVLLVLLSSPQPETVTVNLAGPIAVLADGTARQVVLEDPSYSVRARLNRLAPSAGDDI
jgi:flagellar assembly factor FliW